jgi:hypothetical protein
VKNWNPCEQTKKIVFGSYVDYEVWKVCDMWTKSGFFFAIWKVTKHLNVLIEISNNVYLRSMCTTIFWHIFNVFI